MDPRVGRTVGAYRLIRRLGAGGMGVVYAGEHLETGAHVAIKLLASDDPNLLARFEREAAAQVAAGVHPNVVPVLAAGREGGQPFLVMELIEGGDLKERLREGALEPRSAARLVRDLARGLAHVHERGILHRDIKPENVLFGAQGEPRLTDFGLARQVGSDALTRTGATLGTPAYMSPEQAGGERDAIGPTTDVYGLGATLYQCLSGQPPFSGATAINIIAKVLSSPPAPLRSIRPEIPAALEAICSRALAKEPQDRQGSALQLAEELDRFLDGGGTVPRRSKVLVGAVVAGSLCAVAAGAAIWLGGGADAEPEAGARPAPPPRDEPPETEPEPPPQEARDAPAPEPVPQEASEAPDAETDQERLQRLAKARVRLLMNPQDAQGLRDLLVHQPWKQIQLPGPPLSPEGRDGASRAMAYDSRRERVMFFGGWSGTRAEGGRTFGDLWAWDGDAWTPLEQDGAVPSGRVAHMAAYDPDPGRYVLVGGHRGRREGGANVYLWSQGRWEEQAGPFPRGPGLPRVGGACTWHPKHGLVVFGGRYLDRKTRLHTNALWAWKGGVWTMLDGGGRSAPAPRILGCLVYDREQDRLVLFGGARSQSSGFLGDLWAFGDEGWDELSLEGDAPAARRAAGFVYVGGGRSLLFGGGQGKERGDAWLFEGARWRRLQPLKAPSARMWHAMAWNEALNRVVLFGGLSGGERLGDLWEWEPPPGRGRGKR